MSLEHSPRRSVDRMLRPRDVMALMGWSRSTLWRRVRAGDFPAAMELGPNAIGWPESVAKEARDALRRRDYGAETPYQPSQKAGS